MEKIGRIVVHRWRRVSKSTIVTITRNQNHHILSIVTKASNRAAVHGAKPPVPKTINKEEVDMEIDKEKEKKDAKREDVKKKLDKEINRSDLVSNDDTC